MWNHDTRQHINGSIRYLKLNERDKELIKQNGERKFKSFETRDKPKKRGPRKQKKSEKNLNKNERTQKKS